MKKPLTFAMRGAVGFGLTGIILLTAIANMLMNRVPDNLVYREREPGEAPCIGEWQQEGGSIRNARFGTDGSFALYGKGAPVQGTYHMADATTAALEPSTPWATAEVLLDPDLPYRPELRMASAEGAVEKLAWFRRSAPEPERNPWVWMIGGVGTVFLAGLLGGSIAFLGVARWKRAVVGFGMACIPAILVAVFTVSLSSVTGGGAGKFVMTALGWGLGFALFGGIGGRCLRRDLAWPGAIAFGMPGAFFGFLGMLVPDPAMALLLIAAPLAMGGGIFGIAVGQPVSAPNPAALPTPQPQD